MGPWSSIVEESRIGLVLMLLREGNTALAISVYQDEAGVSFPAAKHSVRELAHQHRIPTRRRSALTLALVALASAIGLVLSH